MYSTTSSAATEGSAVSEAEPSSTNASSKERPTRREEEGALPAPTVGGFRTLGRYVNTHAHSALSAVMVYGQDRRRWNIMPLCALDASV